MVRGRRAWRFSSGFSRAGIRGLRWRSRARPASSVAAACAATDLPFSSAPRDADLKVTRGCSFSGSGDDTSSFSRLAPLGLCLYQWPALGSRAAGAPDAPVLFCSRSPARRREPHDSVDSRAVGSVNHRRLVQAPCRDMCCTPRPPRHHRPLAALGPVRRLAIVSFSADVITLSRHGRSLGVLPLNRAGPIPDNRSSPSLATIPVLLVLSPTPSYPAGGFSLVIDRCRARRSSVIKRSRSNTPTASSFQSPLGCTRHCNETNGATPSSRQRAPTAGRTSWSQTIRTLKRFR